MKANTNEYLMREARKALGKQGGDAIKEKIRKGELPEDHYKNISKKGVEARKAKKLLRACSGLHKNVQEIIKCKTCTLVLDSM